MMTDDIPIYHDISMNHKDIGATYVMYMIIYYLHLHVEKKTGHTTPPRYTIHRSTRGRPLTDHPERTRVPDARDRGSPHKDQENHMSNSPMASYSK